MEISLPRSDKRTVIVGSTGSGKTVDALFLLSTRDFHRRPWIIFDFKGDEHIEQLGATEINVNLAPPRKPGLYVVRPIPGLDEEAVDSLFWKIWENERTGIFIDEGYMIGRNCSGYNACLTQGRSKKIEMIILSQRPRWMSLFTFSEANYFIVKNLTLPDDRKHMATFVGGKQINLLPEHYSYWYIADRQRGQLMKPVPPPEQLVETIRQRMARRTKRI